jgi:hypothetical protein
LIGISEDNHLLVGGKGRQYVFTMEGKTLKTGKPHRKFTPIDGKDFYISPDKVGLFIEDSNNREKRELYFFFNTSLLNSVRINTLSPIKVSKSGALILTTQRQLYPNHYIVLYLNSEDPNASKAYVLKDEQGSTEDTPVFGLDGNIYQSGFMLDDDGGYWVKKFEIPDQDQPR